MVDPDLIEGLGPDMRTAVVGAIRTLHISGVLEAQRLRLIERLATGSTDESAEELAARILDYRRAVSGLRQLDQLGREYLEELKS